jgi:hypothetical protein
MLCLIFHQILIYHILTITALQCSSYGGQNLAVSCLKFLLITFRKLSFSGKKLLSAINKKFLSSLKDKYIILVNLTVMNNDLRSDVYISHLLSEERTRIQTKFAQDTISDMSNWFLEIVKKFRRVV